ncbi:hypothetical protein IAU59_000299 [Kwoniella sp. CBS 9459]
MVATLTEQKNSIRAAVWAAEGDHAITLVDKPIPEAAPHQVLVRIKAASLCHTDHLVPTGIFASHSSSSSQAQAQDRGSDAEPPEVGFPIVAGHEGVGVVVGIGERAREDGKFTVGDRVGGLLNTGGCGDCGECRYVNSRYCSEAKMMGLKGADGVFAEYALMDKDWLVRLPDEMPYEQAAPLTCAGVTIYAAIQRADLKPGKILLISGLGGLGYLGLQIAKAKGLKVIGVDIDPSRLQALKQLPARLKPDLLVKADEMTPEEVLPLINALREKGYDGCKGVDAAIIATDAPSALGYTIPLLATRSKIIITAGPTTLSIPLIPLIFKDLTVFSSLNGSVDDLRETVRFCADEGIGSLVHVERWDAGEGVQRIMGGVGVGEGRKGVVLF